MQRASLIAVLAGEASEAERALLEAWRAESLANEEEYQRLVCLWAATGRVTPSEAARSRPSPEAIVQLAERRARGALHLEPVLRSGGTEERRRRGGEGGRRARWVSTAVVAALVLGLILRWAGTEPAQGEDLRAQTLMTGPMQVATLTLRDGTVVQLAPDSRLEFSSEATGEVVLEGRGFFAVPPGRRQPFRVWTEAGVIEVLGTRFDVNSEGRGLEVAVVEGVVQVVAERGVVEVRAGEVGRGGGDSPLQVEAVTDIYASIEWLGGFLAFQATPLQAALQEIERRLGIEFDVQDPVLLERTVTGWFKDPATEDVVGTLCRTVGAICTVEGENVLRMTLPGRET